MEKIIASDEKIQQIIKILRCSDVSKKFVIEALSLTELRDKPNFASESKTYLTAHNEWCNSEEGSEQEMASLRKRIEFASSEENSLDILADIYDDADDSEDEEGKMLAIRAIANII